MAEKFGMKLLKKIDLFLQRPDDHYEGKALAEKILLILETQNSNQMPNATRASFEKCLEKLVILGLDPKFETNQVIDLSSENQNYLKNVHFPVMVGQFGWILPKILTEDYPGFRVYNEKSLPSDYAFKRNNKEFIFPKGTSLDSGIIDFSIISVEGSTIYVEETTIPNKDKFLKSHYLQNEFASLNPGGKGWVNPSNFKHDHGTILINNLKFEIKNSTEVAEFGHSRPDYGYWGGYFRSDNFRRFVWKGDFRVERKISDTYFFAKVIENNIHKEAAKIKYGI